MKYSVIVRAVDVDGVEVEIGRLKTDDGCDPSVMSAAAVFQDMANLLTQMGPKYERDESNFGKPVREREGEIALAYLKFKVLKDGIKLGPIVRSEIGNLTKRLNEQDPALRVTSEELLAIAGKLAHMSMEHTFGDTRRTKKQIVAGPGGVTRR